ncbi:MAG: hypothetical protein GVY36_18545 [Verrucomicrobia bacterium]|jgi:hypothetical protein|nr:hypothetical protein [Verrucomicrobiota bacterium]
MKRIYEDRYCLFLDILGFRSLVDGSASFKKGDPEKKSLRSLLAALQQIKEGVNYKDAVEVSGKMKRTSRKASQFSDSVIVSYKKDEPYSAGITSIIMDVHQLQLQMTARGILFRGAITVGKLYHDDSFVLGPALNEAVALEKLAAYPRVILDAEILEEAGLKKGEAPGRERTISSMVAEDFDGVFFIDYFNVIPDDFFDEWYEVYVYLSRLRNAVKQLSYKKDPSIKMKHSWMRAKFNSMAKKLEEQKYQSIGSYPIPEEDQDLFREIKRF